MIKSWPLQTSNNCVAYAYYIAMREAVSLTDKYRQLPLSISPATIQAIIRAPTGIGQYTPQLLNNVWKGFTYTVVPPECPILSPNTPILVATWVGVFSHALTLLPDDMVYDPALGTVEHKVLDYGVCSQQISVTVSDITKFPYKWWGYKIPIIRRLADWLKLV